MRGVSLTIAVSALLLASQTAAFKDTSPLLIWSSSPNAAISEATSELTSGVVVAEEIYDTLSSLGCDWDTMILVHVEKLHQSHLPSLTLPSSSSADLHIPYLLRPSRSTLDIAMDKWAGICGANVVKSFDDVASGKNVVVLDAGRDDDLASILPLSLPSPHLLLLTGTPTTTEKRQERPIPLPVTSTTTTLQATGTSAPSSTSKPNTHNSTIPPSTAPLLERYQILTTPIITALLISFLIFIPITAFGISALVGIQVPPRMMEISKGLNAVGKDRKDQ